MIDKASGVPAYRQLADVLRGRVRTAGYAPGSQIPSERDLVAEFGVSRPTVRQAIELLRNEGVLLAEHGRGIFVRPIPTVQRLARTRLSREARERNQGTFLGDAAAGGWEPSVSVRIHVEPANQRVADLLHLSPGAEVCVRDRLMRADGNPVQLATSRLPREITRGTAIEQVDTGQGGVYARLEEAGHRLGHFEELVSARQPTPEERSSLQLTPGIPVLTITRVAIADGGYPVEVNDMVLSAERYQLHYVLPAE
ncbi:GntR family transcriptional regulator [Actinokineospora sp.]|uniref:GntR family transcriptional regulator n=1 Tax=Actinokineospora sp. TaxID=1872133 RepID=UPI003D6BE02A